MPKVSGLGHVGIYVNDLMKQRDFYSRVMGLQIADEDLEERGMVFLSAHPEEEHHEFVIMKGRSAPNDAQVIQQISFKVDTLSELKDFYTVFKDEGSEYTADRQPRQRLRNVRVRPGREHDRGVLHDWIPGPSASRRPRGPRYVRRRSARHRQSGHTLRLISSERAARSGAG